MKLPSFHKSRLPVGVLFVCLSVIGGILYQYYLSTLRTKERTLNYENELVQTKSELNTTRQQLDSTVVERNILEQKLADERNRVDSLANQIKDIQGTVGILEKIRRVDPELLKKYSKVYFLNENYAPARLTTIDPKYNYNSQKINQFHADVWPFLQALLESAAQNNIDLKIASAFRSFYEQSGLKSTYKVVYGAGTANQFSADQGYSEHQLGTTIDFTDAKTGAALTGFEKTSSYVWLKENAYKYGFVLSYPEGNDYYTFEPWHWRFVGRILANTLHAQNKHFYDLDQREIDQYLVSFFD